MKLFLRVITLTSLLFLQACEGPSIGREGARAYFVEHRAALQQVVDQALLCQPDTGRIDQTFAFSCASAHEPEALRRAIQAAQAKWLRVFYDDELSEQRSVRSVHIAIRSKGMAFAGVIEEYIFEIEPVLDARYEREDDGIAIIEREPVTGPPHHWFWRKIDR